MLAGTLTINSQSETGYPTANWLTVSTTSGLVLPAGSTPTVLDLVSNEGAGLAAIGWEGESTLYEGKQAQFKAGDTLLNEWTNLYASHIQTSPSYSVPSLGTMVLTEITLTAMDLSQNAPFGYLVPFFGQLQAFGDLTSGTYSTWQEGSLVGGALEAAGSVLDAASFALDIINPFDHAWSFPEVETLQNGIQPGIEYLSDSAEQIVLGEWTNKVTWLGTGISVLGGLTGLDAAADVRDISANVWNWEWTWGHVGQTAFNVAALLPGVGALKYTDEVGALIKGADNAIDATKNAAKQIPETAKAPLWTSTKSKTSVQNAFDHFKKHKAEFPEYSNAMQYAQGARNFVTNPPAGTLTKLRPNGDRLFYNPATNTFAIRNADGSVRTLFRPTNGINYWNLQ